MSASATETHIIGITPMRDSLRTLLAMRGSLRTLLSDVRYIEGVLFDNNGYMLPTQIGQYEPNIHSIIIQISQEIVNLTSPPP